MCHPCPAFKTRSVKKTRHTLTTPSQTNSDKSVSEFERVWNEGLHLCEKNGSYSVNYIYCRLKCVDFSADFQLLTVGIMMGKCQ